MLFGTGRVGRQTPTGGRTGYGATLPSQDLVFTTDTLPTGITFTRSTTGSYFNSSGVLSSAAINTPRFDHDTTTPFASRGLLIEEARTNSIRNNTMVGASSAPSTLPTNFAVSPAAGLTTTVVAVGSVNGIATIDVRINGTAVGTFYELLFETTTAIAAVNAQVWALSGWLAIVGGSNANLTVISLGDNENNAIGTAITAHNIGNLLSSVNSTLTRYAGAMTNTNALCAFVTPYLAMNFSNGAAIDITFRFGLPQFELGAFATSVIPTSTVAVTRGADIASMPVSAAWFTNGIGTTIVDATNGNGASVATNFWLFEFNDGTITAPIRAYHNGGFNWTVGSLNDLNAVSKAVGVNYKFGLAHDAAGFSASVDGSTTAGDSTVGAAAYATYTSLRIGARSNNTFPFNGYIRRLRYYPRRMSVVELGATTT